MKFQEIAQEFLDKYRMEEGDTICLLRGYHLAARGGEFEVVNICDPEKMTFKLTPVCITWVES